MSYKLPAMDMRGFFCYIWVLELNGAVPKW